MLTLVEAAIVKLTTDVLASVDLYGVRYTFQSLDSLRKWRGQLRGQLARTSRGMFLYGDVRT